MLGFLFVRITFLIISEHNSNSLRAVGVLFSPMVSGWAGGSKKIVRAVSRKP